MAKPVYNDGLTDEQSDVSESFENKQVKRIEIEKFNIISALDAVETCIELDINKEQKKNDENVPRQPKTAQRKGLSGVFQFKFSKENSKMTSESPINKLKLKKKKNLRPSSRQRRKTLDKFVNLKSKGKVRKASLVEVKIERQKTIENNIPSAKSEILTRICSSRGNQSSYNLSYKSFDFDDEAPPPQFMPAYYEYQQRVYNQAEQRRYMWQREFFGVYRRRRTSFLDLEEVQTQTDIVSVTP